MSLVTQTPKDPGIAAAISDIPSLVAATDFRPAINTRKETMHDHDKLMQARLEQLLITFGFGAVSGGTISAGSGLSVSVAALKAYIGHIVEFDASQTVGGLTNTATNRLWLRQDGTWTIKTNTDSPDTSDGHGWALKWGEAVTAGGAVTSVDNERDYITFGEVKSGDTELADGAVAVVPSGARSDLKDSYTAYGDLYLYGDFTVTERESAVEVFEYGANVRRFGAVGDGSTDDTAAIQRAINAVGSGGGVVFAPPGEYYCPSPLIIDQRKVLFRGAGEPTIFTTDQANAILLASVHNKKLTVRDMQFKGNGIGIKMDGAQSASSYMDALIENCFFRTENIGIYMRYARESNIRACQFDYGVTTDTQTGIYLERCVNTALSDCDFKHCAKAMHYYGTTDITSADTGTATAGASTTLTDGGKAWTVNAYSLVYSVRITGGTGAGQVRKIKSNTATVLTVATAWSTNPDNTSTYQIESYATNPYDAGLRVVNSTLINNLTALQLEYVDFASILGCMIDYNDYPIIIYGSDRPFIGGGNYISSRNDHASVSIGPGTRYPSAKTNRLKIVDTVVINHESSSADIAAIELADVRGGRIRDCSIELWWKYGIRYDDCNNLWIESNYLQPAGGHGTNSVICVTTTVSDNLSNRIINNDYEKVFDTQTAICELNRNLAASGFFRNTYSGTITLTAGNSNQTYNHNMAHTPQAVILQSNGAKNGYDLRVGSLTTTQFTVYMTDAAGAPVTLGSDLSISWFGFTANSMVSN